MLQRICDICGSVMLEKNNSHIELEINDCSYSYVDICDNCLSKIYNFIITLEPK